MQQLEKEADALGHSYATMMEIAGRKVADQIIAEYTGIDTVLVLVGPGNNGGDGLVCARYLAQADIPVQVYLWRRRTDPEHDYEQHYAKLVALSVSTMHVDDDNDFAWLQTWLENATVVVDALLGTGSNRPITGQLTSLLQIVRASVDVSQADVIAIDCASGLNCDTGAVDPFTVPAAQTITFAHPKHGHYQFPGPSVTGKFTIADIGIPSHLADDIQTCVIEEEWLHEYLPQRPSNSHKGTFGKAMAVVGCTNYPGAAYLSLAAAGRVGAGLITGAVSALIWPIVAGKLTEATWVPLHSQPDTVGVGDVDVVLDAVQGYTTLLVGCGLGNTAQSQSFVQNLLTGLHGLSIDQRPSMVVDADGLNCLAQTKGWSDWLTPDTVLTPHPAEMARLCNLPVKDVVANRWALAREKAQEWGVVVLVKGPYTVIANPEGQLAVLPFATAALATAGTGDVLAGIITGLLAQGVPAFTAACLGSWLHVMAGRACMTGTVGVGVLASDLLPLLPRVINDLAAYGR